MATKPDTCIGCPLFASTEGPVWGKGKPDANLMFVGEAPGEEEGIALEPFKGGSGKIFNAQLAQAGIPRSEAWVTNVVKCRPTARGAGGKVVNRTPTKEEIRHCARYLVAELKQVAPNTVVALGNVAMQTLTDTTKGITTVRSVPMEGPIRMDGKAKRFKIVGTIHPANIMRSQDMWPAVIFDLMRANRESAYPDIRRRQWNNNIRAKISDVGPMLMKQLKEHRMGFAHGFAIHDLETTGLDPRKDAIRCIGISANPTDIYVFEWTPQVAEFVKDMHGDPEIMTVGQNSEAFDIWFQEEKGTIFRGPSFDTLVGWHQLNSSLPKALDFIGATVTDEIHWKDKTMYKAGDDALQIGCGKDIHATAMAFYDQLNEMRQLPYQEDLYFKHIMPLQPVLRRMRQRGMKKDQRKAGAWSINLNKHADVKEVRLKKHLGADFNVNSPQQLMDLLYKKMGLPVQYKQTRDGFRPTVDADALDELAKISKDPILLEIRGIRTLRKWDSTFVHSPQDDNGFVHPCFGTAQAANGRLNCTDPNAQNFPVLIREIMVPDTPDHVFIARDWSQIEWRIAMALSGDKYGLDALAAGRDAHKDSYSQTFKILYDAVTKAQRDIAKAVNYGLLYGRGAESVSQGRAGHPEDQIPLADVENYMKGFLSTFTGYFEFRKQIDRKVRQDHYYETAWHRRRYWYSTRNMPEAYNFPISGTAAHMMYEVLVDIDRELPKGAEIKLSVHDEVMLCSVKEQKILQQAMDCMRDNMSRAFKQVEEASLYPDVVRHYYPGGWNCPSEGSLGEDWRATKCAGATKELEAQAKQVEKDLCKRLGVRHEPTSVSI